MIIVFWVLSASIYAGKTTPEELHNLVGHIGGVTALVYNVNTTTLFSGSGSNELIQWDTLRNTTKAVQYSQIGIAGNDCDDNGCGSAATSSVRYLALDIKHHTLFSSDARGVTIAWNTMETPARPTNSFACAVEAMPAPAISLRLHDVFIDSDKQWIICSSACVDDYGSCPVDALTEIWHQSLK